MKVWGCHTGAIILPSQPFLTNWMMMRKHFWSDLGAPSFSSIPEDAWNLDARVTPAGEKTIIHFADRESIENIGVLRRFKGRACFYLVFKRAPTLTRCSQIFIKNSGAEPFNWCYLSQVLLSLGVRISHRMKAQVEFLTSGFLDYDSKTFPDAVLFVFLKIKTIFPKNSARACCSWDSWNR